MIDVRCTKTQLKKKNFKMYSKISRGKPSHQLKEENEKAEYHSWSLSLPPTAAEKIWKKSMIHKNLVVLVVVDMLTDPNPNSTRRLLKGRI